jgi:diguanylate cyclase (GGDEF)-like protein
VRVAVPVQTGVRWATLVGTLSEEALAARLADRRTRLVLSAVIVSLLGLVALLLLLSVEVLEPLRQVVHVARRMAAGDLNVRAPVRGGAELMTLAHTLNEAARRLQGRREELEAAVQSRTVELTQANAELHAMNDRLERLAITDPLTGLFNRRYLEQALHFEVTRQKRGNRPFSVAMIDVDSFKHYNDAHGHPAGDVVLKELAVVLQANLRASDIVARYGGEEFVVILLDVDGEAAMKAAEKLRAAVEAHPFPARERQPLGVVSISLGVGSWPTHGTTADAVLSAADRALYESKARGKNRVTLA